jgi:hypothetical protein
MLSFGDLLMGVTPFKAGLLTCGEHPAAPIQGLDCALFPQVTAGVDLGRRASIQSRCSRPFASRSRSVGLGGAFTVGLRRTHAADPALADLGDALGFSVLRAAAFSTHTPRPQSQIGDTRAQSDCGGAILTDTCSRRARSMAKLRYALACANKPALNLEFSSSAAILSKSAARSRSSWISFMGVPAISKRVLERNWRRLRCSHLRNPRES